MFLLSTDQCKSTLLNKNTFTYFTYLYHIHPSLTITCNHIDISIINMVFRKGNLNSSIIFLHRSLAHTTERSRPPILVLLSEAWMHRVEFWFKVSWYTTRIMIQIHEWYGFLKLLWSIIRVTLNFISELKQCLNHIDNIPLCVDWKKFWRLPARQTWHTFPFHWQGMTSTILV